MVAIDLLVNSVKNNLNLKIYDIIISFMKERGFANEQFTCSTDSSSPYKILVIIDAKYLFYFIYDHYVKKTAVNGGNMKINPNIYQLRTQHKY